jgi:hypothetical protein
MRDDQYVLLVLLSAVATFAVLSILDSVFDLSLLS